MELKSDESFATSYINRLLRKIIVDSEYQQEILKKKFELLELIENNKFSELEKRRAGEISLIIDQRNIYGRYAEDIKKFDAFFRIISRLREREKEKGLLDDERIKDYVLLNDYLFEFRRLFIKDPFKPTDWFRPSILAVLSRQEKYLRKVGCSRWFEKEKLHFKYYFKFKKNVDMELSILNRLALLLIKYNDVLDPQILTAQSYAEAVMRPAYRRQWKMKVALSLVSGMMLLGLILSENHIESLEKNELHASKGSKYTVALSKQDMMKRRDELHRLFERAGEVVLLDEAAKPTEKAIGEVPDDRIIYRPEE